MPERFFNTAGAVIPEDHYCLPPLARLNLDKVLSLVSQQKYLVLHAPRQSGKTSCLLALMQYLNHEETYTCLYANVENAQAAREDVAAATREILGELASNAAYYLDDSFLKDHWQDIKESRGPFGALSATLTEWCKTLGKPLVLLIDEIDSLIGDTLIAVLRQLRSGFTKRPTHFPQSVILCGVRDVRDYRIHSSSEKAIITGGSAFNIKAESLRLGNFLREEVEALYGQHTVATGQVFDKGALDEAWELTCGQPWPVNALGYETCSRMEEGRDRSHPITAELVLQAKERLIERRETHLDQLADKLREERVRRVVEPLLAGEVDPEMIPPDDIAYVYDLGLIRTEGQLSIANRIYQEVIPRELTYSTQLTISQEPAWYVRPDGKLDMPKLLAAFQEFFREHSEHWVERCDYKEAGPQLLMQAFLQRIVNGGGRVEREYGLGRKRTDLLVVWPYPGGVQKTVIELKVLRGSLERTLSEGLEQTKEYMSRCGSAEGHLIIFDRDPQKPWEEKVWRREESCGGQGITVWGM